MGDPATYPAPKQVCARPPGRAPRRAGSRRRSSLSLPRKARVPTPLERLCARRSAKHGVRTSRVRSGHGTASGWQDDAIDDARRGVWPPRDWRRTRSSTGYFKCSMFPTSLRRTGSVLPPSGRCWRSPLRTAPVCSTAFGSAPKASRCCRRCLVPSSRSSVSAPSTSCAGGTTPGPNSSGDGSTTSTWCAQSPSVGTARRCDRSRGGWPVVTVDTTAGVDAHRAAGGRP